MLRGRYMLIISKTFMIAVHMQYWTEEARSKMQDHSIIHLEIHLWDSYWYTARGKNKWKCHSMSFNPLAASQMNKLPSVSLIQRRIFSLRGSSFSSVSFYQLPINCHKVMKCHIGDQPSSTRWNTSAWTNRSSTEEDNMHHSHFYMSVCIRTPSLYYISRLALEEWLVTHYNGTKN